MSEITWTNDTRKLSDLVPWEHNPKRMTKKQAEGLRLSIERFGFAVPFLVSPDGDIYDGHQRQTLMNAIKEYGPNATVDVRVSSRPLSDDERRELVVRLKQNQAGWDFDMLPNLYEREELLEWGFEPEELGMFPDDDKPDDPGAQIDKAEELRVKWQTAPGQLWQLGEHRLICGDCTDRAVVERVMGGEQVDLVVTDPPYAVDYAAKNRALQTIGPSNRLTTDIQGDTLSTEDTAKAIWEPAFANAYEVSRNGAVVYCFAPQGGDQMMMMMMMLRAKWNDRLHQLIWRKNAPTFSMGRLDYSYQHEPILYSWRGTNHGFYGDGARSIIDCDRPSASKLHPTMKPVELLEILIRNSSRAGEIVYEPFLGSGTTLIACERLGRRCRAVEIAPGYVAVALERWAVMTGLVPVLLENNSNGEQQSSA